MQAVIRWYRDNKLIKLSDGTEQKTFDEFREYAGVDKSFNIDKAVEKVNRESDRPEFVPACVRGIAKQLRERRLEDAGNTDTCPSGLSDSVCDSCLDS